MKKSLISLLSLIGITFLSCEKMGNSGSGYYYATDNMGGSGQVGNTDSVVENRFVKTGDSAVTTFSVDADGGSYALSRRLLTGSQDISSYTQAIRTEEFINYFTYNYPDPSDEDNIAVNGEVSTCPWNTEHKLVRIGIKGKSISKSAYPPANFVLLIDVSGSMSSDDKLELLKNGFISFANQMRSSDKIAIVTYAGKEAVLLESTAGSKKNDIVNAIKKLGAGGSTNGAGGIQKAYEIANRNFIPGGNNRVILGTDGDFNVGITNTDDLIKLVEDNKSKGIYLTTLGVGLGNYNESMMEKIANKGDGTYEYLDSEEELKKVFIDEYSKFVTVAKDVKVQVSFNKDLVEEYRLIGYENRALTNSDFEDDSKDAGEIGAGQTITALYEIKPKQGNADFGNHPSFAISFRYKKTANDPSVLLNLDVYDNGAAFADASENMRFSASLAALGLYLRNSSYKGSVTLNNIKQWAANAVSFDPNGYRSKHLQLLNKVK
ncbi:MAG: von Willebrand factor type A domain-containing protein [Sphingobacteriales bacterium]|nr:von Willebrand factor type A domain-containing protein [Sphingobacteriales bacterium]